MSTMARSKISLDVIKRLRDQTGAPIGDVRNALDASGGDEPKALAWLKQRSAQLADKRQGRSTGQGRVEAYIHHDGRMGALVEVGCETDFVARTADFIQFCKELALHVAAVGPRFVSAEEASADLGLSAEELKAVCLLEQPFVKDPGTSVGDLVKALIGKTGENVVIKRFAKFTVGQAS